MLEDQIKLRRVKEGSGKNSDGMCKHIKMGYTIPRDSILQVLLKKY